MARIKFGSDNLSSGGLLNDVDVTVKRAYTDVHQFKRKNGEVAFERTAVCLDVVLPNGEVSKADEGYGGIIWKVGDPAVYQPTDDQTGIEGVEGRTDEDGNELAAATQINNRSDWGIIQTKLEELGFPKALLEKGDVTVLNGLKFHVVQIAIEGRTKEDGKKGELLCPTKIDPKTIRSAAGGGAAKSGAKTKPAAKAAPKTEPAPAADSNDDAADADDYVTAVVTKAVETAVAGLNGTPVPVAEFGKQVFRAVFRNNPKDKNHPEHGDLRKIAQETATSEEFLAEHTGQLFDFDGDNISSL